MREPPQSPANQLYPTVSASGSLLTALTEHLRVLCACSRNPQSMATAAAPDSQCDLPKNVVKRIVKEKLSSIPGGKADLQINKEALLAFGESAKVWAGLLNLVWFGPTSQPKSSSSSTHSPCPDTPCLPCAPFLPPANRCSSASSQQQQTMSARRRSVPPSTQMMCSRRWRTWSLLSCCRL